MNKSQSDNFSSGATALTTVALIGASGNAGSRILDELTRREHRVTAIVRNPNKVPSSKYTTAQSGDVHDLEGLAALIAGHDVVVSSVHFTASDPRILIAAVRKAHVPRYIVVGGAGSLKTPTGQLLIDTGHVPLPYVPESRAGVAFLEILREVSDFEWSFLSPSAEFVAGRRTGRFRLGNDQVLKDDHGRSWISYEDYAVALVDEIESNAHRRQRFTVGY
jgi:putative NADH-flavin reductase